MEANRKFYHGLLKLRSHWEIGFLYKSLALLDLNGAPGAKFQGRNRRRSRHQSQSWSSTNLQAFRERLFISASPTPARSALCLRVKDLDGLLTRLEPPEPR